MTLAIKNEGSKPLIPRKKKQFAVKDSKIIKKKPVKKLLAESIQAQVKSKGIKWLAMENDLNWSTYEDIKKNSYKTGIKISS